MSILVLDQEGRCQLERPYLNKFSDADMLVNSVWVGHQDAVDFTQNEKDFLRRLGKSRYQGLVISCGVSFGMNMLEQLRKTPSTKRMPVTIL